jgi:hypothetical protein
VGLRVGVGVQCLVWLRLTCVKTAHNEQTTHILRVYVIS